MSYVFPDGHDMFLSMLQGLVYCLFLVSFYQTAYLSVFTNSPDIKMHSTLTGNQTLSKF